MDDEKPLDDDPLAAMKQKLQTPQVEPAPLPVAEHTHDLEPLTPADIALLKEEKKEELAALLAEPPKPVTSEDAPEVAGVIDTPETSPIAPVEAPELDEPPLPPIELSKSMVIQIAELEKHDAPAPATEEVPTVFETVPPLPAEATPPSPETHGAGEELDTLAFLPPPPPSPPLAPEPTKPVLPTVVSVKPLSFGATPPLPVPVPAPKPAVAVPFPKPGFFLKGPAALKEEKEQRERQLLKDALERPIEELEAQQRINSCLALLRNARKGNDAFRTRLFGDLGRMRLLSWGIIVLIFLAVGFVGLLHGTVKQLNTRIESLQFEFGEVRKRLPPAWEMDCRLADIDKDWARGCVPRATTPKNQ